jgi:DNA-binding response OmpR family regulator
MAEELPPFGAADLLPLFRKLGETPLIILGTGDEGEEIEMLEAGADDYLRWPLNRPLLVARVSAAIRRYRSGPRPTQILSFDDRLGPKRALSGRTGAA